MVEDNVKAQMRKGILDYCILAILSQGDSYAPKIIAELKEAEMIRGRRDAVSDSDAAEECGPAHLPVGRVPAGTAPQVLFAHRQGPGVPGFAG